MERNFSRDYLSFTALSGAFSLPPPPRLPQSPVLTTIQTAEDAAFPQGFGVQVEHPPGHCRIAQVRHDKNVQDCFKACALNKLQNYSAAQCRAHKRDSTNDC